MTKRPLISIDWCDDEQEHLLDDIRELVGDEVADKLIAEAGGMRISLPRPSALTPNSRISRLIGYEDAKRIVDAVCPASVGVAQFTVPLSVHSRQQRTNQRLSELLSRDGLTSNDVARLAGVHVRTVYRHKARMRRDGEYVGTPETLKQADQRREGRE